MKNSRQICWYFRGEPRGRGGSLISGKRFLFTRGLNKYSPAIKGENMKLLERLILHFLSLLGDLFLGTLAVL